MSTLTMADIAVLASVKRPVVTVWRSRPVVRGQVIPFPAPVQTVDGVEHFSSSDVVTWLDATGRGNRRDGAALDAPALGVPDGEKFEDVVTLLAWHVLTGRDLAATTAGDRIDAAHEVDAGDRVIRREIETLTASDSLLTYVDDLLEASFGPADALDRAETSRLGRREGRRDLTDHGVAVIRSIVDAAVSAVGDHGSFAVSGDPALAVALAQAAGQADSLPGVALACDDGSRAVRRRCVIRGIEVAEKSSASPSPTVRVSALLGLDTDAALDAVDEAVLELSPGDVAVIVGAGGVLADALRGEAHTRRVQTLSSCDLVVALRLPRGLWRSAHRQNLAVWVCRGGEQSDLIHLGDIENLATDQTADLTADVAGALAATGARSFRFTRQLRSRPVARGAAVIPRGISAPVVQTAGASTHLDRVHTATMITSEAPRTLDTLVAPSRAGFVLDRRSLGELVERGQLRTFRRTRIDFAHATPAGTVAVQPDSGIALDPIDAELHYPRATRTEVGDVIVAEKPPRAWVDETGGALVASPAFILRGTDKATVGPYLIAAAVNAATGGEWRSWRVPLPDPQEAARLEATLADAAHYRRELQQRLAATGALESALIEGIAAGTVTLDVTAPP